MRFVFQESLIWDGAYDRVDPTGRIVTIKARKDDEEKARRRLPETRLGRRWILVEKLP